MPDQITATDIANHATAVEQDRERLVTLLNATREALHLPADGDPNAIPVEAAAAFDAATNLAEQLATAQAHHAKLHTRINALENDLRSQTRAVHELTAELGQWRAAYGEDSLRIAQRLIAERDEARKMSEDLNAETMVLNDTIRSQAAELADAQELLAVLDDVTEQLDRARARYATRPAQADDDERTEPHEDPARLRQQLAEAHADCARYATERDEARRLAESLKDDLAAADTVITAARPVTDSDRLSRRALTDLADALKAYDAAPQPADLGSPAGRAQVSPECSNSSPQVHATCDGCTGCLLPACRCFNANRAQGDDLADRLAAEAADYRWTNGRKG